MPLTVYNILFWVGLFLLILDMIDHAFNLNLATRLGVGELWVRGFHIHKAYIGLALMIFSRFLLILTEF